MYFHVNLYTIYISNICTSVRLERLYRSLVMPLMQVLETRFINSLAPPNELFPPHCFFLAPLSLFFLAPSLFSCLPPLLLLLSLAASPPIWGLRYPYIHSSWCSLTLLIRPYSPCAILLMYFSCNQTFDFNTTFDFYMTLTLM